MKKQPTPAPAKNKPVQKASVKTAPPKGTKNALVVKEKTAPPVIASLANKMYANRSRGLQNITLDDVAIPFVSIIQSGSPQKNPRHEKYIEGAEEGDIFNTVTNELYASVDIVPTAYKKVFVEWKDRKTGGGFVRIHDKNSAIVQNAKRNEDGKIVLSNGNLLVETAQFFVLLVDVDNQDDIVGVQRAVLAFTSTQLKKSRKWVTQMRELMLDGDEGLFNPPMFAYIYTISTQSESNDKGSWFGWNIEINKMVESERLFDLAQQYSISIDAGEGPEVDYSKSGMDTDVVPPVEDGNDDDEHDAY